MRKQDKVECKQLMNAAERICCYEQEISCLRYSWLSFSNRKQDLKARQDEKHYKPNANRWWWSIMRSLASVVEYSLCSSNNGFEPIP